MTIPSQGKCLCGTLKREGGNFFFTKFTLEPYIFSDMLTYIVTSEWQISNRECEWDWKETRPTVWQQSGLPLTGISGRSRFDTEQQSRRWGRTEEIGRKDCRTLQVHSACCSETGVFVATASTVAWTSLKEIRAWREGNQRALSLLSPRASKTTVAASTKTKEEHVGYKTTHRHTAKNTLSSNPDTDRVVQLPEE